VQSLPFRLKKKVKVVGFLPTTDRFFEKNRTKNFGVKTLSL